MSDTLVLPLPSIRLTYRGFTLLEIMVVIAIIAIIASIITPNFAHARQVSQVMTVLQTEKQVAAASEIYFGDYHRYPPSGGVNAALFGGANNSYWTAIGNGNGILAGQNQLVWRLTPDCAATGCTYEIIDNCTFDGSAIPSWIHDLSGNPGVKGTQYSILYDGPLGYWIFAQAGVC